jgi:hypothetical protein
VSRVSSTASACSASSGAGTGTGTGSGGVAGAFRALEKQLRLPLVSVSWLLDSICEGGPLPLSLFWGPDVLAAGAVEGNNSGQSAHGHAVSRSNSGAGARASPGAGAGAGASVSVGASAGATRPLRRHSSIAVFGMHDDGDAGSVRAGDDGGDVVVVGARGKQGSRAGAGASAGSSSGGGDIEPQPEGEEEEEEEEDSEFGGVGRASLSDFGNAGTYGDSEDGSFGGSMDAGMLDDFSMGMSQQMQDYF